MSPQTPVELSEDQRTKLFIFRDLLLKWQRSVNLVGNATIPDLWRRHFVDSLQLIPLAGVWRNWVDIGSGGGFPGLVAAIMGFQGSHVHLIESDKRKAAFLAEVSRETSVAASIHVGRIESVLPPLAESIKFDIISARALAEMGDLIDYATPVLQRGGRGLFLKGKGFESELTNLAAADNFKFAVADSTTEPGAKIVIVQGLTGICHQESGNG